MRSLSALKNLIMSLLYELILIVFGLIVPRMIIQTYGSEVNGLTSTITQTLSILNLLQAGAVGASIFQMFKPVAEKDYYQQSLVLESSKRYFRKLGGIFLLLVAVAAPVMAVFTKSAEGTVSALAVWEKLVAFLILGINGSFYFFFSSWYDILFSSNQKRFLLSVAGMVERLLYYGLLFGVLLLKLHFLWMYVVVLMASCVRVAFLHALYCKHFKANLVKVTPDKDFKIPNRGYLLINQISAQSADALPVLIISYATSGGFVSASIYGVYNLVQNMIKMVVRTLQTSISEVFGNLVVSADDKRISRVYNLLEFAFFLGAAVLCCCAAFLFMPFIYLYTDGNSLDVSYMFPALAVLMVLYSMIYCMYMPCYTLTNVYGLFKETWLPALISAAVAAVASVGLALLYWPCAVLAPVFFYTGMMITRLYTAEKRIPWFRLGSFFRRLLAVVILVAASAVLSHVMFGEGQFAVSGWGSWIVYAAIFGVLLAVVMGVYIVLFERSAAKGLFGYAKRLIAKKLGKNKTPVK